MTEERSGAGCKHADCSCPRATDSTYCGPECESQVKENHPIAEGPQKGLDGQMYEKAECPCGHLDCDQADPEPTI